MSNPIGEWQDAFENQVSNRTNVLDLAAHYPYSPERWRIFVDGSRVFPEYDTVSQYAHTDDTHDLQPGAGETVVFESAERPRYVVQYELAATWAFATNQSLTGNDQLKIGLYDGEDGWYMEHRGDHPDDQTADFVLERDSTEVYRKSDIDIARPVTTFARLKLQTGWYDVTRQRWERSYSDTGTQQNPEIGSFSADDARGSRTGNLPIHYEVTADASDTGIVLNAGSAAQVNLGTTTQLKREKTFEEDYTFSTTDAWVPMLALRVPPDKKIINVQLSDFQITEWDGADDLRITVQSHDPSKVLAGDSNPLDDSDYFTPDVFNEINSAIEISDAVAEAPDGSGTPTTSTSDPGGWQLGWAVERTTGSGSKTKTKSTSVNSKRPLYGRDVAVVWGNADNTESVQYDLRTEQDW